MSLDDYDDEPEEYSTEERMEIGVALTNKASSEELEHQSDPSFYHLIDQDLDSGRVKPSTKGGSMGLGTGKHKTDLVLTNNTPQRASIYQFAHGNICIL